MDEMRMIGDMLDEPPTEQAAANGRRRLQEEIAGPSGEGSARAGARTRRGIPRFPLFSGLGLLAAGAAAAVAISVVGSGAPPPAGPEPAPVDLGKQAVLAAAENAAAQKVGKYWFTDEIWGQSYIMRPETGSYAIVGAHSEFFRSTEVRTGAGGIWGRDIPSRPLTPKDVAAWKKAGSPSRFRVWSNDHYYTYDLSKTEWSKDSPNGPAGPGWMGGKTFEELQSLANDSQKLAEMFLIPAIENAKGEREELRIAAKRAGKSPDAFLRDPMGCIRPSTIASRLLILRATNPMTWPLPPAARAGLMRELAEQPGIESIGKVVDPLGRAGVALASEPFTTCRSDQFGAPPEEVGKYRSREMIVFAEETGKVLATQSVLTKPGGPYKDREPGFVISYHAYRDMGWTGTKPEPPAKLPSF